MAALQTNEDVDSIGSENLPNQNNNNSNDKTTYASSSSFMKEGEDKKAITRVPKLTPEQRAVLSPEELEQYIKQRKRWMKETIRRRQLQQIITLDKNNQPRKARLQDTSEAASTTSSPRTSNAATAASSTITFGSLNGIEEDDNNNSDNEAEHPKVNMNNILFGK